MSILSKFYTTYISKVPSNKLKPPRPNFFDPRTNKEDGIFLKRTILLAEKATLVAELGNEEIQRSPLSSNFFVEAV